MRTTLLGLLFAAASFAADPALLQMVPSNAATIAGVDLQRVAGSQLGQMLLTRPQTIDPAFADFMATTGFDPRRDLREVLFAGTTKQGGLVLMRGTFDTAKLLAKAQTMGAVVTQVSGASFISKPGDGSDGAFALLDSSTVIAGKKLDVQAALAQRSTSSTLPVDVAAKVSELSGKYDAWMISNVSASQLANAQAATGTAPKGPMPAAVMQNIERVTGGLQLGSNVLFEGEAQARTERDAQALLDVAKFLLSMVQANTTKDPQAAQFAALLNNMQMTQQGNLVKVSFTAPVTEFQKFQMKRTAPTRRTGKEVL